MSAEGWWDYSVSIGDIVRLIISLLAVLLLRRVLSPFFAPSIPTKPPRLIGESPANKGTGKLICCTSPATGEKLGDVNALTKDDVEVCVKAAQEAQREWSQTSFAERRAVMEDLIAVILEQDKEICTRSMEDTGKTLFEAEFGEILTTCEKLRHLALHGEEYLRPQHRSAPLLLGSKAARLEYHPLGVIGIIIPWNYPFHNVLSAASAAIFSGNAALIKVSEWSTNSKLQYEKLLRGVLARRGHNPNLVQLLPGFGDTGDALVRSSGVSKVLFIGSPATGKKVMRAAADNLTPVILELGGKDPMVVFDDVSFDWALAVVMRGCFINLGQNCISSERVYVHEKIFDRFSAALAEKVKSASQGPTLKGHYDFGAMTMPAQVDIVEQLVTDAVKHGAKILAGGCRNAKYAQGNWYEPTVVSNVKHDMRIVNEEVFGPVALLIKFADENQLISMINSTPYALGCSILSGDVKRAERVGKKVVSGMVTINDYGVSYLIQTLPFGGAKDSGFGRFNGPEGLRGFCREQSVVTDKFRVVTPVPRLILYPVSEVAPVIIREAIHALYLPTLAAKLGALFRLIKLGLANPKQFALTF